MLFCSLVTLFLSSLLINLLLFTVLYFIPFASSAAAASRARPFPFLRELPTHNGSPSSRPFQTRANLQFDPPITPYCAPRPPSISHHLSLYYDYYSQTIISHSTQYARLRIAIRGRRQEQEAERRGPQVPPAYRAQRSSEGGPRPSASQGFRGFYVVSPADIVRRHYWIAHSLLVVVRLINYCNNTRDFMVPSVWGQVRFSYYSQRDSI